MKILLIIFVLYLVISLLFGIVTIISMIGDKNFCGTSIKEILHNDDIYWLNIFSVTFFPSLLMIISWICLRNKVKRIFS